MNQVIKDQTAQRQKEYDLVMIIMSVLLLGTILLAHLIEGPDSHPLHWSMGPRIFMERGWPTPTDNQVAMIPMSLRDCEIVDYRPISGAGTMAMVVIKILGPNGETKGMAWGIPADQKAMMGVGTRCHLQNYGLSRPTDIQWISHDLSLPVVLPGPVPQEKRP